MGAAALRTSTLKIAAREILSFHLFLGQAICSESKIIGPHRLWRAAGVRRGWYMCRTS